MTTESLTDIVVSIVVTARPHAGALLAHGGRHRLGASPVAQPSPNPNVSVAR